MLGFEALGVFALGQGEPWTLTGKELRGKKLTRAQRRGRVLIEPRLEPQPSIAARPSKPKVPQKPRPIDPAIAALIAREEQRQIAFAKDEDDAIAVLLLTAA